MAANRLRDSMPGAPARFSRRRGVFLLLLAVLVPGSQARADEEWPVIQHWWNFVVELSAQHRDGGEEHGHGLIVGQLRGEGCDEAPPQEFRLACIEEGLIVLTANHLVRRPDGQPAARIQVRSQWDAGGPRMALPLGLFDARDDIAMVVVPAGEAPRPYSVAVGCSEKLMPASRMMLGLPPALFKPTWGRWVGRDEAGRLLFQGLEVIRGGSGAPIIDSANTVIGISTASEGSSGVSTGISFERAEDLMRKGVGDKEVDLTWNVMPTCGCVAQLPMTEGPPGLDSGLFTCTEPALWTAVRTELLQLRMDPLRQLASRFAARPEDFPAVFVEKVPGSLWAYYQERLAGLEPAPTEAVPMPREGLALGGVLLSAGSLPRCGQVPVRHTRDRHHLIQELFFSKVELLGLRRDLLFCELELGEGDGRQRLLFLALNGRWVFIPEE